MDILSAIAGPASGMVLLVGAIVVIFAWSHADSAREVKPNRITPVVHMPDSWLEKAQTRTSVDGEG